MFHRVQNMLLNGSNYIQFQKGTLRFCLRNSYELLQIFKYLFFQFLVFPNYSGCSYTKNTNFLELILTGRGDCFKTSLRKKCPYSELFWSTFSHIRTEYGEIQSTCPYSVRMWENKDQNISEYGHFSRSVCK